MDVLANRLAPAVADAATVAVPLVVDLDGTLLRTDTLVESLFAAVRGQPRILLALPGWLRRGPAFVKQQLAAAVALDVARLPVDEALLAYLRTQHGLGRRLVLASGADTRIAQRVADAIGLFDTVLASDGVTNLSGADKRDRLVALFGERGFDYAGNSARDLPAWGAARRAIVVNARPLVAARAARHTPLERVIGHGGIDVGATVSALRIHHWSKNLLLLAPLLVAQRIPEPLALTNSVLGVLCFCLVASGVYLLNDLFDLEADRRHPHKRQRALASGRLPVLQGLLWLPALWGGALWLSLWFAPVAFALVLAAYVALMIAYSIRLKAIAGVDVLALAAGYTLRVAAGALAAGVAVAPGLLASTAVFFLGLALLKRYAELVTLGVGLEPDARIRGYRVRQAPRLAVVGLVANATAMVIFALPTGHASGGSSRSAVWLACLLMSGWIGRLWWMAHRGRIHDDPVAFALRDTTSMALGLSALVVLAWPA